MAERLSSLPPYPTLLRSINLISGSGSTNQAVIEAESRGNTLNGLTKTVAIISSDPEATGIQKAIDSGFPNTDTYVVKPKDNLQKQLLDIFSTYNPDFYHQLGWLPFTPLMASIGLNQHYGPGGKWMYGVRRAYAHQRFCELVQDDRPVPVFSQLVASSYDAGDAIYYEFTHLLPGENPEQAATRILTIEHRVQIEARRLIALGETYPIPLPKIALNEYEEELLLQAKKEARDKYPPH